VNPAELARLLGLVAANLEKQFPDRVSMSSGIVRQGAEALRACRCVDIAPDEPGCRGCGADLKQPTRGRRRKFCEACSPRRARKTRENDPLISDERKGHL